jgi:glycosyltransferase involved in cell wall biosynthesis
MRLLFLSRWYPYPANNGSKIRIYNLVKYLGQHHDVYFVSFTEPDDPVSAERIEAMRAHCREVRAIPYHTFNPGSLKAVMGFLGAIPRSLVDSFSPEMHEAVQQLARLVSFDAVIASQVDMPIYTRGLQGMAKILEEVEISIFLEQVKRAASPLKKMRKQLMWSKWSNYMRGVMQAYDAVTVVSEPEIHPLQQVIPGYERISVLPNGADLSRLTGDFANPQPNTMVYTGALTYYVNFDAMQFFLADVFPLIAAECPEAVISMAGRLEGTRVAELPTYPNAKHVGYLSDVRPFVQGGWLSVIPERVGGGTRIKLFESLALGTPVIATKWAATGVSAREGIEILTADTPSDLAAAILRLFGDTALRESLSRAGRKLIEDHYDWLVIGRQLDNVIEDAVRHHAKISGQKR